MHERAITLAESDGGEFQPSDLRGKPIGASGRRRGALALIAALPWVAVAAWTEHQPAAMPAAKALRAEEPQWRAALERSVQAPIPWIESTPTESFGDMTMLGPIDTLASASEARADRIRAARAQANTKMFAQGVTDWVSDGTSMRPLFATSGWTAFAAKLSAQVDMGRLTQLRRAMADHARDKPKGWGLLVSKAKAEWASGGDQALFKAVDAIINEVPYVDGTDGSFFSPARLFSRGGVCKDFVAAKYILLREAGFPADRLRVAVLTPRGPGSEWHVVLLARAEGARAPQVLDLLPFGIQASELARAHMSKAQKVGALREAGIDPDGVDYGLAKFSLIALANYGTRRGIDWVGNENGGAAFARTLPELMAESAFEAAPGGITGYAAGSSIWMTTGSGSAPYSLLVQRLNTPGEIKAAALTLASR